VHLLIPVPISPREMDGISTIRPLGAARLGGVLHHAWGDARPDRALACTDCYAGFARARYSYQPHTMRALRAVAYLTNALQVRRKRAGSDCASPKVPFCLLCLARVDVPDGDDQRRPVRHFSRLLDDHRGYLHPSSIREGSA
jgi:hypothetical protein